MKNKPKTNKWVAEKALIIGELLEMRFGDGAGQSHQVKIATNEMLNLITQTQQETLEWCLDEVVGEDEKLDYDWRYPDGVIWDGRCQLKAKQRKTIKQRKEETCSTHVPDIDQCYTSKKDNK